MDPATGRNLELTEALRGGPAPTLFSLVDECATGMGSRLLRHWLHHPLRDRDAVAKRHEAVAALQERFDDIHSVLRRIADVERITARVALKNVRPRELSGLRDSLGLLDELRKPIPDSGSLLSDLLKDLATPGECLELLTGSIPPEPAARAVDGGVIAEGYSAELDELRRLQTNAGEFLMALEARERERTGIPNLRVGFNQVHGYYIEVTSSHTEKVPAEYRRRQTLKSAERYITPELKTFEDKALSARDRALALEKSLYDELLALLAPHVPLLQRIARALAQFDALCSYVSTASKRGDARPQFVEDNLIEIEAGRHPVVEAQIDNFIANDCRLSPARRLLLVTGPNMGGKSTYMRQVALIALMAHAGSFVPARAARLGPVDQIFTRIRAAPALPPPAPPPPGAAPPGSSARAGAPRRGPVDQIFPRIGAADDLAGGRSTFMVEMTESANILHNATERSLVLMDEVGRGTSTFDGLALAWAIARHLVEKNRSLALFATHYFEMTRLALEYREVANVHLDAVEHKDTVVFLHAVEEGPANQSYGLQVAALAGVGKVVIRRAQRYLEMLEDSSLMRAGQEDLFVAAKRAAPEPEPAPDALREELAKVNPDELSPREALELLYRLKKL